MQNALGDAAHLLGVHDPEFVYETIKSGGRLKGFSTSQHAHLREETLEPAEDIIERCISYGVKIVTPDDELYPERLLEVPTFPAALYCRGDEALLKAPLPIALIGSREPLVTSVTAASALAGLLSNCGFTVVSGGARGVDHASHTGALNAGAGTIAVLGTAINDHTYLRQCESLREVIAANGLLVSEYPPDTVMARGSFPKRNRIIAGMTVGTVVIEAGKKSGSLGTAAYAAEFGRDVFALSAKGSSMRFAGAEDLLADGAISAVSAYDVICEYINVYGATINFDNVSKEDLVKDLTQDFSTSIPTFDNILLLDSREKLSKARHIFHTEKKPVTDPLSGNARKVYAVLDATPRTVEDIYNLCMKRDLGLKFSELTAALCELEVFEYLDMQPDRKYKFKQDGN